MVKRGLDVMLSSILLLFSLPFLVIAALLIRMNSHGPVLFRQVRMGRDFKQFTIFKLRTMLQDEAGMPVTSSDDPRITRVGRLLRGLKIDELPQLWNVLRGEMSLVGPRPILPVLVSRSHDAYVHLLQVRPGLTDPASLKYCREARLVGSLPDDESCRIEFFDSVVAPDKARMSAQYMARATVWSDIGLILMTVLVCAFPYLRRVYGELPDPQQWMIDRQRRVNAESVAQPLDDEAASEGMVTNQQNSRRLDDYAIFSHGLVELEASREEEGLTQQPRFLPWIPVRVIDASVESSSQRRYEGDSHL